MKVINHEKYGLTLHHCAISVPDLEETIKWYGDKFGFVLVSRSEIPGQNVKVAHMKGSGFILEIFEVHDAAALPADRRHPNTDFRTHGVKHFSIGADDAKGFVAELSESGVEVVFIAEVDGTYGAFILDNTGNLIEIFDTQHPISSL
jgi:methylmalonyl-CoA/ethylmalonyl-CoA epimerase